MNTQRSSGVLLHPTSLSGPFGIGTIGCEARRFLDFLSQAGQKLWQVLPLGPTGFGDSPYQCFSAFAGNPLLIDLEALRQERLLTANDLRVTEPFSADRVDYPRVIDFVIPRLKRAFLRRSQGSQAAAAGFRRFCHEQAAWLDDYALFMAIKDHLGGVAGWEWPVALRQRQRAAIQRIKKELAEGIAFRKFVQYLFHTQWTALKAEANASGIHIVGDIPIFAARDSADVWSHPELFLLDKQLNPRVVAGVPPDYFSETGQLWGNPIYDWRAMKRTGYRWWIDVLRAKLQFYDMVRIDHFRGFAGYWAIARGETTAVRGAWRPGPGKALFKALFAALGELPIIAEDLGVITPDVVALRDAFGFPGMKVLQFAFDSGEDGDHRPHNLVRHSVAYTGTHDNDTSVGWYEKARPEDRRMAEQYMGAQGGDGEEIAWAFIRTAWASVAQYAIAPLQDILALGSDARMNIPGTMGNWTWRLRPDALTDKLAQRLAQLTRLYSR